jgi:hypothetical protein
LGAGAQKTKKNTMLPQAKKPVGKVFAQVVTNKRHTQ